MEKTNKELIKEAMFKIKKKFKIHCVRTTMQCCRSCTGNFLKEDEQYLFLDHYMGGLNRLSLEEYNQCKKYYIYYNVKNYKDVAKYLQELLFETHLNVIIPESSLEAIIIENKND